MIPSYDDLTPPIPDIAPDEVLTSVERLLPRRPPIEAGMARGFRPSGFSATVVQSGVVPVELFASLHGSDVERLTAIACDFSPRIQQYRCSRCIDVVLDVSGLGRLLGEAKDIGRELAGAGAARVAVLPSRIGARLLARGREGLSVAGAGEVEKALSTLPLSVLRQLILDDEGDAGPFDVLDRWGLRTVGEFAALPAADLSARLGQGGVALQQLARGIDPFPLVPDPGVPRFVESMELEWPIDSLEPLSFVFARLLDLLSAALERADRGAVAIRLALRLTDRTTEIRLLPLPVAMRDPRVLRTLLLLHLESHPPSAAIDIVSIEADPAPSRIIQYSLLERALPSAETLATLNARLGALIGAERCGSPALLDTHRPDGFTMQGFGRDDRDSGDSPQRQQSQQRKIMDLSVVPVASVVDSSPFAPPGHPECPVLRRFRPPVAIRVTIEGGRPVRIAIDRQGMPGGRVLQAAGPWRTSGAWWDQPARAKAGHTPWDRDEWDVVCGDGAACRIFRDRRRGVWFLEGVFD
jgi:protein ImuB